MDSMAARRLVTVVLGAGLVAAAFSPVASRAAVPTCAGKRATIVGTSGPDRILGTRRSDVVVAKGGNDTIETRAGRDTVCSGRGRDRVNGGGDRDLLLGEAGNDVLDGGADTDTVNGGRGFDTCLAAEAVTACEVLGKLPGAAGADAQASIPNIRFPDPPSADLVAPEGIPVSVRDLVAHPSNGATVGQVNDLLASIGARIVGGNPFGDFLLLRLTGTTGLNRVLMAQETVEGSPAFAGASINFAHVEERLPPHNVDTGSNRWTWEVPRLADSGNWGLKTARVPQAWNLYERAVRRAATVDVLVVEAGPGVSAGHPDLSPRVSKFLPTDPEGDHGTMVAGIIGAIWDNKLGVEGIYPRTLTIHSRRATFQATLQDTVTRFLTANAGVRVVNYSAGNSKFYGDNNIDPVNRRVNPANPTSPTWREQMNRTGDTFLAAFQAFAAGPGGRDDYLFFCSAGNLRLRPGTTLDYEARDNSPCANLAFRGAAAGAGADHFLSVESMNAAGDRASTSASGGTVSAPGVCVRSTEHDGGVAGNYDRPAATCPARDGDRPAYATNSGTSFASPFAAGVAAYVWSLFPALDYQQLREVVTDPANRKEVGVGAGGGAAAGSERVDLFAAAMGVDVLLGSRILQRALVDVDDGSRDGNFRYDPIEDALVEGMFTPDQRRGDGRTTMRDFRAFRDAFLAASEPLFTGGSLPGVDLDGSPRHFKKDLNMNGCIGGQLANHPRPPADDPTPTSCADDPGEDVYARYDFNADGRIEGWTAAEHVKEDLDGAACAPNPAFVVVASPGCLRDVDVLADALWENEETDGYHEDVLVDPAQEGVFIDLETGWSPLRFLLGNRETNVPNANVPDVLEETPDYLHSADLHVRIDWDQMPIDPDHDKVTIRIRSEIWPDGEDQGGPPGPDEPFEVSFERSRTFFRSAEPTIVELTVPIWKGNVKAIWTAFDIDPPEMPNTGAVTLEVTESGVQYGDDCALLIPENTITCDAIA